MKKLSSIIFIILLVIGSVMLAPLRERQIYPIGIFLVVVSVTALSLLNKNKL